MKKTEVISQLHTHACKRLTELKEDRTILWLGESDEISHLTYVSCTDKSLYISDNMASFDVPYSKIKKITVEDYQPTMPRKWLYMYLSEDAFSFKIAIRLNE